MKGLGRRSPLRPFTRVGPVDQQILAKFLRDHNKWTTRGSLSTKVLPENFLLTDEGLTSFLRSKKKKFEVHWPRSTVSVKDLPIKRSEETYTVSDFPHHFRWVNDQNTELQFKVVDHPLTTTS